MNTDKQNIERLRKIVYHDCTRIRVKDTGKPDPRKLHEHIFTTYEELTKDELTQKYPSTKLLQHKQL